MSRFLSALDPASWDPGDPGDTQAVGAVAVVGVPFDGATTYRAGAAGGPAEARAASQSIETWCPKLQLDLEDGPVFDHGDLALESSSHDSGRAVVDAIRGRLDALHIPAPHPILMLGGDHLVAYPFLTAAVDAHETLTILHIDAHLDMRAQWEGDAFNHATVMGRVLDHASDHASGGPACNLSLVSWGIRSGTRAEFASTRTDPRVQVFDAFASAHEVATALGDDGALYITLDVDGIDPSEIPGTGTPEPDGLRFGAVESLLGLLRERDLIGADIVELAPALDPTGRSSVAVARLARGLLLLLREASRRRGGTVAS